MAGDATWTNTVLLIPGEGVNGSTVTADNSLNPATVTLNNGAAISTTRSKYGASSIYLDGVNDHITTNRAVSIGTGMFTLEAHVRPTAAQTGRIFSLNASGNFAMLVSRVNADGSLSSFIRSSANTGYADAISAAGLVAMNDTAWYHVALTRNASNLITLWLDGAPVLSFTSATNPNGVATYGLGSQYASAEYFKGYLANIRAKEGVCLYTAPFTPPARSYPVGRGEVEGVIRDDTGAPCARIVRLIRRDTGALITSTTSDATTGWYRLSTPTLDEVCRIVHDDSAGALYNDLIDRVIPA